MDGLRAPFLFEGAVRDAVHALKYGGLRAAARDLGAALVRYLANDSLPADLVVPVPLHPRRERERGYNQALLLAREVTRHTRLPLGAGALRRDRNTPPQVSLAGPEERRTNTRGAFVCPQPLAGARILLVDDVITTGSTMADCAAALKEAGASSVWGVAVARQGRRIP